MDTDILVYCIQAGESSFIESMSRDPNAVLPNGLTPLEYAVRLNRYSVAEALLKKNADPNLYFYYYSPLTEAKDVDLARLLLSYGANPDTVDEKGATALMGAFNPEILQLLIHHGATINLQDKYGRTALHYLTATNDKRLGKKLRENGADAGMEDNYGMTADVYSEYYYYITNI